MGFYNAQDNLKFIAHLKGAALENSEFDDTIASRKELCSEKNANTAKLNHDGNTAANVMKHNDPNDGKYRQLPCRTFISVGTCPYRDRCVYLHDPRILCREAKSKTRKKCKEDVIVETSCGKNKIVPVQDTLFWPAMHPSDVKNRLDVHTNSPHVIQCYHVPVPYKMLPSPSIVPANIRSTYTGAGTSGTGFGDYHDRCLYSMWMNFADFCSQLQGNRPIVPDNKSMNGFLGAPRLPVFVKLSKGQSLSYSAVNSTLEVLERDSHLQAPPQSPVRTSSIGSEDELDTVYESSISGNAHFKSLNCAVAYNAVTSPCTVTWNSRSSPCSWLSGIN